MLENLDSKLKEQYKVELDLVKDGLLNEEQFFQIIEKDKLKKQDREKLIKKEKQKRNMTSLIELLNKKPELLNNIKSFMDYRKLRIEQVLIPIMIEEAENDYENFSLLNIDMMRERVYILDKQRREKHNRALSNFSNLMNEFEKFGIPPIYTGNIMDPLKESDRYGNRDIRQEMTDSMLEILSTIEEMNINELNIETEKYDKGLGSFKEIYKDLNKQTHDFGIKKTLESDDGDILI